MKTVTGLLGGPKIQLLQSPQPLLGTVDIGGWKASGGLEGMFGDAVAMPSCFSIDDDLRALVCCGSIDEDLTGTSGGGNGGQGDELGEGT